MSELLEIKQKILEQDLIPDLLNKAGCSNVKLRNNRYEAQLPDKFESDNVRALQVYLNEFLSCKVRTRTFNGNDIYDLISYIVFDCDEEEDIKRNLPRSKQWICEQLGLSEYLDDFIREFEKPVDDPLDWLKDLRKQRNKKKAELKESQVYDESILNQYIMYPYAGYIEEGVDYQTQVEFQVGLDVLSERIVFPVHNDYGQIISVKGRTLDPDYKPKGIPKFMYLYNINMAYHLYNWHRAKTYILDKKEVIIFESEKACWLASQWGYRNCVALGSSDVTEFHVRKIKSLGLDISIVLAYDKDKTVKEIKDQAKKFGYTNSIFIMYDDEDVFSAEEKHSPTDLGNEPFDRLYQNRLKYKLV